MTSHAQIIDRRGTHFIGIAHGFHANFGGELRHFLTQIGQWLNELGHGFVAHFLRHQFANQFAKFLQTGTLIAQHLAAQQIERLNAIGAFVDHVDARITHVLLHAPLFDVAVATKHLLAQGGGLKTVVGQEGFDDGGQQRQNFSRVGAHFFVRMVQFFVEQQGTVASQRAAAFCVGLGRQQHAAYIGVNQNRIGGLGRRFDTREAAHLQTVFGIRQGVLVGHFGQAQRLVAHTQTGTVHHHKHGRQTFVGLTHHVTRSAIEHHLACGIAMDAHFVL